MLKLIKGGTVFAPEEMGRQDILTAGGQIVKIARNISIPTDLEVKVIKADGKTVVPGFIDSHVHITGAGGSEGPASRTHEVSFSALAKAGLTTVVGTLGIDTISFNLQHLLVTALALEQQGISTYIYTGGYQLPPKTILDSVLSDISLIEKVVGVKVAIFDALSSHPGKEALVTLASQTWLGGRLGGKAGLVHFHIGDTNGSFVDLANVLKGMGLPTGMFVTTHINRSAEVLGRAVAGGKEGLSLDITALYTPDRNMKQTVAPAKALRILLDEGIPLENITMSSDSNAAYPFKDEAGVLEDIILTPVNAVAVELRKAVKQEGFSLDEVLKIVTVNPAQRLRLARRKGSLTPGKDADIVILDEDLQVDTVLAKGQVILKEKAPIVKGYFEDDYKSI
jgi:beta-aspartyl-dipeptidase (metallo-type)